MSVQKLYRCVIRQRVNWTPGTDTSVPESKQPAEVEGYSIERDITDYVEAFRFQNNRGTIATDMTVDIINPNGILTPTNADSEFNRSLVYDGTSSSYVDSYAPLLAEGNEFQFYRVNSKEDLVTTTTVDAQGNTITTYPNRGKWSPRFRGKIHLVESSVTGGQDSLRITVGSVLTEMNKRTFTGTFSPIMRTTSQVPGNSFYTLPRLVQAVEIFRDIDKPVSVPKSYTASATVYGQPSETEPGEISAQLLSKLLWWDQTDIFYKNKLTLAPNYFDGVHVIKHVVLTHRDGTLPSIDVTYEFTDETHVDQDARTPVPVQDSTATAIWTLNGQSWMVESGTVTKDQNKVLDDPLGALKLQDATMRFDLTGLPTDTDSLFGYGLYATDTSSVRVQIVKIPYHRLTYTYGTPVQVYDSGVVSGPTEFHASELGGLLINPPTGTTYQWKRIALPIDPIPNSTFDADTDTDITIYQVRVSVTGTAWIDNPRWEFTSVDVSPSGQAVQKANNLLCLPRAERWLTEDGIIYRSPYPQHRVMSRRNNRVLARDWGMPYAAGTLKGFAPNNMKNRALPEGGLYNRELVDGADFEVLYEKGAIQLTSTYRRTEFMVAGTYYDLPFSPHMEAAEMMRRLMIEAGIPDSNIDLEATGVVLSQVTMSIDTTTSLLKALKDILSQLPQNYHLYEDGDGNVRGRYIQQNGSPRIYNPVIQTPLDPMVNSAFEPGAEYWYGVTALMPDGKETLVSNLMSTVPYSDYYDFQHQSIVTASSVPTLKIKPVPNMVGLVVRRAKAYKTAADTVVHPVPKPVYRFPLSSSGPDDDFFNEDLSAAGKTGIPVELKALAGGFVMYQVVELAVTTTTPANPAPGSLKDFH